MAACWPCWHYTCKGGGHWFWTGWDTMMDDVGFLSLLLAITLTLYDDLIEEPAYAAYLAAKAEKPAQSTQSADNNPSTSIDDEAPLEKATAGESYGSLPLLASDSSHSANNGIEEWVPCNQYVPAVAWGVLAAELA